MQSCGLETYAVRFKHSCCIIYWLIRCVVGLHLNRPALTRDTESLTLGMNSKLMPKIEIFSITFSEKHNFVCGENRI